MSMVSIICPSVKRLPSIEPGVTTSRIIKINPSPYSPLSNHLAISQQQSPINIGWITKEIKAIYRTFWSGMHHKKCEGTGGGGLSGKVCYFFTTSRGARVFFTNLENLSFFFFCNAGFFFMKFWFCRIFFPANYSVSLPESVGMRSHIMGVVKPVAQGRAGYSKGTLSSQSL